MSETPTLWAHSPAAGGNRWHPLEDHLRGTADLAAGFASPFGGGEVAYWLGLLHDVGKACCAWQEKLSRVAGTRHAVGIDHKALGTRLARDLGLGPYALGIWGHHGGLIDGKTLDGFLKKRLRENADNIASAQTAVSALLPELASDPRVAPPPVWLGDLLVAEMAMRLVFSALCDADYLDTAAHFDGLAAPRVRPGADFGMLRDRFEKRRAGLLADRKPSPVDALRQEVYDGCVTAAIQPPGIFRLAAPTGAGKTLASAGFGLHHAAVHGMRRVIVAVPFLTITEQNAAVYRELLDDEAGQVVLEHHSGVDFDSSGQSSRWGRLAAENWDAPFVVTTFVRLFESLFARKPAAMRRVHRLAGAVIVLDEVQALPHHLLVPILDGLRLLVKYFGTTVVLSSATQPDFWALSPFKDLDAVDLTADPARLASDLSRVRFEWRLDPQPTLAEIAANALEEQAAMVVVNTTADARAVYDHWRAEVPEDVACHLSTRMCPEHRRRVLEAVRRRLTDGQPVLLVSTQLIEAGVDVDFPVVFRAIAPADSLLQAAGRANREGRLPGLGRVVIFAPADGKAPPSYKPLVSETQVQFGPDKADPDDLDALNRYYRSIYGALNLADPGHLGQQILQSRRRWEFQTVADGPVVDAATGSRDRTKAFRLITDAGISVVTPQGAASNEQRREVEKLVKDIRTSPVPRMADLRRLQPYTTNLHPGVLRTRGVEALLDPILGTDVRAGTLVEWRGHYDNATGIDIDPRTEDFVL